MAAGALAAVALGVPATMVGAGPAHAATVCTPSTATPAVTIDQATLQFGDTIAFHGTGWCHPSDGGSTIGVKLDAGAITRLDTSVNSNKSVWAIVTADPASGDFSGSFTLPDGTAKTSSPAIEKGGHTLTFLSGSLKSGDAVRSQAAAFTVGAAAGTGLGDGAPPTVCKPTTTTAEVHLGSTQAALGGLVHVTGSGFCNPAGGGSVIGVKLDDGGYALPTGSTVWTTIHADDADGTFSADIRLPDGTTATSVPAFGRGGHTLRFLTGSLATGDTVRTLKSATFSIGAYAPSGLPDPLAVTDLNASSRHGATVVLKKQRVVVRLPQTPAGTWVLATLYDADGSPSYPWETWQRLPTTHQLTLARAPIATTGAAGRMSLAVQSGDEDRVGDLLGWAPLRLPAATSGTSGTGATGTSDTGSAKTGIHTDPALPTTPAGGTADGAVTAAATGVAALPQRPFASYTALDPSRHGSVRARSDAGLVTLTVGGTESGDLVYVDVYTPTAVLPAGWATIASDRTVKVDLTGLEGYAGATVQSADGTLLGWAPLALGDAGAAEADGVVATEPAAAVAPGRTQADDDSWLTGTDGLLLAAGAVVLAGASVTPARRRRTPGGAA